MRESVQSSAMIKTFFSFLIIVCLYVAPASAQDKGLPVANFEPMGHPETAFVLQVIDPHTVQLEDGRLIRLAGIDFPDYDVHQPGDISVTALRILRDMLESKDVNIYQTKKRNIGRLNRMGHHVAHIERRDDNVWVQGSLVSLGLARVRTTKRNPEMADTLYQLEKQARDKRLGLWVVTNFDVITPKEAADYTDSFNIIEGKVESATIKKNWIYLNFGKNWRDDFTVAIAPSDKRTFAKAGLDPLQWGGKTIRVRGWIVAYNGPYMEINHAQAVELMKDKVESDEIQVESLPEASEDSIVRSIEPND
ncbi:MAG: nuclease [Micavibrio sp.]|nr:MAG: nuclease [Micavibrio sp.]